MAIILEKANLQPFGEYDNPAKKKGRPPKKLCEKNVGSVIRENPDDLSPFQITYSYTQELAGFDAWTIENVEHVSEFTFVKWGEARKETFRYIVNKSARAYKGVTLGGIRHLEFHRLGALNTIFGEFRVVCISPACAVFIFVHLLQKLKVYNTLGYRGLQVQVIGGGVEDVKKKNKKRMWERAGDFDMETCGMWKSKYSNIFNAWIIRPCPDVKDFELNVYHLARLFHSLIRCFQPEQIIVGDWQLIKGAVGWCKSYNEKGEMVHNGDRIIRVDTRWRSCQDFGTRYNMRARCLEYQRPRYRGEGWWYE